MKLVNELLSFNEAKTKELPGTHMSVKGFGKDNNGNSIVKLVNDNTGKGFSIQTNNGDMPDTHRLKIDGTKLKELTDSDLKTMAKEIGDYVKKYGTKAQKA